MTLNSPALHLTTKHCLTNKCRKVKTKDRVGCFRKVTPVRSKNLCSRKQTLHPGR